MAAALCAVAAPSAARPSAAARLVVLVVVDQMRGVEMDCAAAGYTEGLAQLCREGRVYRRATLGHGLTETASGHATLATGAPPHLHGVLDKRLYHRPSGTLRDVCDFAPSRGGYRLADAAGCNAAALMLPTLGERLRHERPGAQVVAIGAKARSANLLAGTDASVVAWSDAGVEDGNVVAAPRLVGRSGPRPALPNWLTAAFAADPAAAPFVAWEAPAGLAFTDAIPPEQACDCGHGPAFPHRLVDGATAQQRYNAWLASPASDAAMVAAALVARAQLHLGEGDGPDLLLLSLAATDRLGHCFGPEGPERRAVLAAVDQQMGRLLSALRTAVPQGLIVAVTADHGMMPRATPGRRTGSLSTAEVEVLVQRALQPFAAGQAGEGAPAPNLRYPFVFLPPTPGPEAARRAAAVARVLSADPAVWRAWSAEQLARDPHPVAQLMAASHQRDRGGDVVLALRPYFRPVARVPSCGSRHGSPWHYDRDVPLVLWGDGVEPGQIDDAVDARQLTTTLGGHLELAPVAWSAAPLP